MSHIYKGLPGNIPRFSRESQSFSLNLLVFRLEHQISREIPSVAFQFFFHELYYFRNFKKESKIRSGFISAVLDRKKSNREMKSMFCLRYTFCLHFFLINIHIFDHPDSRLSGQFTEVPTSPDNRGSTVYY